MHIHDLLWVLSAVPVSVGVVTLLAIVARLFNV